MSNYQFSPSPSYGIGDYPFVTWENGFSEEELNQIIKIGSSLEMLEGKVDSENNLKKDVRRALTSWIEYNNDTAWLYDRLAYITRCLNGKFYKFDLYGFSEHMQFTEYKAEDQGHYTWHIDTGLNPENSFSPRKLSIVLQLSDPEEYEGGDLELFTSDPPLQILKCKGLVAAFPSYTLHRVTPVTKGIRRTLVVWTTGPSFR